jgi:hypothetical protein
MKRFVLLIFLASSWNLGYAQSSSSSSATPTSPSPSLPPLPMPEMATSKDQSPVQNAAASDSTNSVTTPTPSAQPLYLPSPSPTPTPEEKKSPIDILSAILGSAAKNNEESSNPTPTPKPKEMEEPKNVKIVPSPSKEIQGVPVKPEAKRFMNVYQFMALFSSKNWSAFWNSPDFPLLRVTSLSDKLSPSPGIIIPWQRDVLGNPAVYLKTRLKFPRLHPIGGDLPDQPIGSATVVISQHVVFYLTTDGWMANASPMYVIAEEKGKQDTVLLPVARGQGAWRSIVGPGGIYVENFIGAGLAAARTELSEYFSDEEIHMFLQGNSDVIFYLRPPAD